MSLKNFILTVFFFITVNTFIFSQGLKFEHFSVEQGLSNELVYSIFQDNNGFLWIGTFAGLNRFDGTKFYKFDFNEYDSEPLVRVIFQDNTGNIWIGTDNGLNRFEIKKKSETELQTRCSRFLNDPEDKNSISNNVIKAIYQSTNGDLWIGTVKGLNKITSDQVYGKEEEIKFVSYISDSINNHITSIVQDKDENLWLGTMGGGLNKFDIETESFVKNYLQNDKNPNGLSSNYVMSLYYDKDNLWIGTYLGGFIRFQIQNEEFTVYKKNPEGNSISDNRVLSIKEDKKGNLWLGTGMGVNSFNPVTGKFESFSSDPRIDNTIKSNYVRDLFIDNSDNLWAGTLVGLEKANINPAKFLYYKNNPWDSNSLRHNQVISLCEDYKENLWIGTYEGLDMLNYKTGIFTHYKLDRDNHRRAGRTVYSLYEDKDKDLWIGTFGGGLYKFNRSENNFKQFRKDAKNPKSILDDRVLSISEDNTGDILIGTLDGVCKFDKSKKEFSHYILDPKDSTILAGKSVETIYYSYKKGVYWVGTRTGPFKINKDSTCQFVNVDNEGKSERKDSSSSVKKEIVYAFCEDGNGNLWIGTSNGLIIHKEESKEFLRFTINDGLPNNVINSIMQDNNGNTWISTSGGIAKIDFTQDSNIRVKAYSVEDGLQGLVFNEGAAFKNKKGLLFWGGTNGFNICNPSFIVENQNPPKIVFTSFKKFDKEVKSIDELLELNALELSYSDRFFSFEFAALDFTIPEKNQYAYKLEGFDDKWNYIGNRHFASYTNIDPGEYIFRVKGSNNDGVWNEEGASIKIIITPPFYSTWWAYTFYFIAFLSILYVARKYEMNRLHLKNRLKLEQMESEKLKEINEVKSKFFANISHEFRTPLTLILGPIENVINKVDTNIKQQLKTAHKNGNRLLRLINQLLDLSKLEAGAIELKAHRIDLIPYLKGILFSFESLSKEKNITLRFYSENDSVEVYIDTEKMEQVFYNLISNAIKFTPENSNGEIKVKVTNQITSDIKQSENNIEHIQISIVDTGTGIPADQLLYVFDRFYQVKSSSIKELEGTGIGLALAKEIVELHSGNITVNSKENKGTEFIITLPLGKDSLKGNEIMDESSIYNPQVKIVDQMEFPETVIEEQTKIQGNEDKEIVLIVEDNKEVRKFIVQQLKFTYSVIETADGEEGFEKATHSIPDLIISDVMMPNMDGNELSRKLKNDNRTSHIPIILLTAKGGKEAKLEGLETGADDYIMKPFNSSELIIRVKNLIKQRNILREKFSREQFVRPDKIILPAVDKKFLNKIKEVIEKNIGDEKFSVENLAGEIALSRVQLHRKLKALTNQSASEFILNMRLQRAADLIKQDAASISEIAYMTGFNTPNYFAKSFRKHFGCSPSEYKGKVS